MLNLLALLSTLGSGALPEQPLAAPAAPPVRLWMNNDRRFRPGDRVRLQVDADVDGYLLVLNYDTDGRVRVLFPLDPRDDARVQAGRRYEVRDNDSEAAFRASGDGTGLIFTAVAREPWRFDQVVLADRWDYTRIEIDRASTDPEADLSSLVQSIAGPEGFDYDVLGYRVYGQTTNAYYGGNSYYGRPIYLYDDYLFCNNWNWRYNGCHRWPYDGGFSFGFGYSNYGFGYPYGGYYGGYFPYGGYYPYRPYGRSNTIVGRPRNYAVLPRTPAGGVSGGFGGVVGGGRDNVRAPDIDWRTRARPAGGIGNRAPDGIVRGGGRSPDVAPPARRARGDGVEYPGGRGGSPSNERSRARGGDEGGRSAPPPPRSEPSHRSEPAHSSGGSGGSGGGHSSPPPSRPRRP